MRPICRARRSLFMCMLAACGGAVAAAATLRVPQDYPRIQIAVNAAAPFDEIVVFPGTYNENVNFGVKTLILRSTDPLDPAVVAATIIDGTQSGSVVQLTTGMVQGLTLRNGRAANGGGVSVTGAATIANNVIEQNSAEGAGGGVWANVPGTVILANVIRENTFVTHGGGVAALGATTIRGNTFSGNRASTGGRGGGVYGVDAAIENNTLKENQAAEGAAVYCYTSLVAANDIRNNAGGPAVWAVLSRVQNNYVADNPRGGIECQYGGEVLNNTLFRNSLWNLRLERGEHLQWPTACNNIAAFSSGIGLSLYPGLYARYPEVLGDFNCVFGNALAEYSDPAARGAHDINSDPRLAPDDWTLAADSPCINAADPASDIELVRGADIAGAARVRGCGVDIGAYEAPGANVVVLAVRSPLTLATIGVSARDCANRGDAAHRFNRYYAAGTTVTLSAPPGVLLVHWIVDGKVMPAGVAEVTTTLDYSIEAIPVFLPIENRTRSLFYPTFAALLADSRTTPGDEVVAQGAFYREALDLRGRSLRVRSVDPHNPNVMAATILESPPALYNIQIDSGRLSGFTIQGRSNGFGGGQISGTAVVEHCSFHRCLTVFASSTDGSVTVRNCRFDGLGTHTAGALYASSARILNNTITRSNGDHGEAALNVGNGTMVRGNTIVGNYRGLDFSGRSNQTIEHNIVAFNGTGFYLPGPLTNGVRDYNCVFGNQLDYWGGVTPAPNDLSVDPQLAADGVHVLPGSPCINAGRPDFTPSAGETDLDGQLRRWGAAVDIGADEFGSFAYGDLSCDGAVDFFDVDPFVLALFDPAAYAAAYPLCRQELADVNGDAAVNFFDIDPFIARVIP